MLPGTGRTGSGSAGRDGAESSSGGRVRRSAGGAAASAGGSRRTGRTHQAAIAATGSGFKRGGASAGVRAYKVKESGELLPFLITAIAGKGRNAIKSMLTRGQITVNGRSVKAHNYALLPGMTVSVHTERAKEEPVMTGLRILHEDESVLVIDKEAGLLSIASAQEKELTAYRQLMAHVRRSHPNNRIFIVHRLDRDTSGVMMFAKSEAVQQALQQSWQESVRERSYVALVEGAVKQSEGRIESWLKETSTLKMYSSPTPNGGQLAITHYKTLEAGRDYTLLEVRLETGRKNQIRVHMQDLGHPIVGDKKYGSKSKAIGRLGLHARVLAFVHPVTGKLMRFQSAIPKAFMKPFAK